MTDTTHICPIHGEHDDWEDDYCSVVVLGDPSDEWERETCDLRPVAPTVAEALRTEGAARERDAVVAYCRAMASGLGFKLGETYGQEYFAAANCIEVGRHLPPDGDPTKDREARIRADEREKCMAEWSELIESGAWQSMSHGLVLALSKLEADVRRQALNDAARVADAEVESAEAAASRCRAMEEQQRLQMEERSLVAARVADDIRSLATVDTELKNTDDED